MATAPRPTLKHALAGAEARSGAARRADRGGDHAAGRRRDDVHAGLSAVHAGAAVLDAGPHRRRPLRLEHRHRRARTPRRRISASTSCRRASSATRWPTNTSIWSASCSIRGMPDAVVMDRETGTYADFTQGPADPFRGQVLQVPRPAEHGALAAGQAGVRAGRRLAARPRLRRAGTPTRSSPPPTASRA